MEKLEELKKPEKKIAINYQISRIKVENILINDIEIGKRFREDLGDIQSLASSIKTNGLIQPIAICKNTSGNGQPYKLIAGGRRFYAIEFLMKKNPGDNKISCRIFPEDMSEYQLRILEYAENIYRKSFTWQEECNLKEYIHTLQQQIYGIKSSTSKNAPGWSLTDTAIMTGKSKGTLSTDISLAKIMKETPEINWSKFKTKSDAQKALKQARKTVDQTIEADKAKIIIGEGETRKRKLIDSYHVKDFFQGVEKIGNATMDFIEIDPPYAIDLQNQKADYKYSGYNEINPQDYSEFMKRVFKESYRVLKNNRWMICWFGPEPWFESIYQWLIKAEFKTKRIPGLWIRGGVNEHGKIGINAQTKNPEYSLANGYEMFFAARKGSPTINQPGSTNVFIHKPVPHQLKVHPTERPLNLISEILTTFTSAGSNVLVPFAGSGNTMISAAKNNMVPIGFDLTEEYFDSYIIKIHKLF